MRPLFLTRHKLVDHFRCAGPVSRRIPVLSQVLPCVRALQASWNVMAHAQKPDFVFRRNGRVHLNRHGDVSSVDYWHSRGARISGSNAGYVMFRGSVKSIGYPLHSPVSPSLPLPYVTVWHQISTGVNKCTQDSTVTREIKGRTGRRGRHRKGNGLWISQCFNLHAL